ncbi:MAG: hypothetical protein BSOLF_2118 [Candidatus Carbobacillus altaicus]|uniref:Uncharacterized protein n=1 Tax=Candidatus Carbonibacillus altaicus TaxID=2163959 RepID=A0A2R6XYE4_9BACL|nr:MAG: hypothetical protein BSOLF_2118 [Candidatus Carbobacillus altaicus]
MKQMIQMIQVIQVKWKLKKKILKKIHGEGHTEKVLVIRHKS